MRARPLDTERRAGFSLVEMMVAFAILAVVLGGVFGSVRATMKASTAIHAAQRERDGVTGLFDLCQLTFPALPPATEFFCMSPFPGTPQELTLRSAPQAFPVDARRLFFGEISLVSRPQPNGAFTVGIEYRSLDRQNQPRPAPYWLPLLRDVQSMTWAFYDPLARQWLSQWTTIGRRPGLVRLSVALLGDSRAWTQTFWMPRTAPVMLAVQASPAPPKP